MASWCLMHLIRPSGSSESLDPSSSSEISTSSSPPSMTVWRWFAECLSEGDGQPLQRVGLGALTRLLSSADPASPGGGEVSVLLSSKAFLQPFFLALAYNHRKQATEGGLAGTDQWSMGVKEIMHDVGRGDSRELVSTVLPFAGIPLSSYPTLSHIPSGYQWISQNRRLPAVFQSFL